MPLAYAAPGECHHRAGNPHSADKPARRGVDTPGRIPYFVRQIRHVPFALTRLRSGIEGLR